MIGLLGLKGGLLAGAGVLVGMVMFGGGMYLYGKGVGKSEAAIEALSNSVEALRDRGKIDEQITGADVNGMCRALGLSGDDYSECMRRVGEASADTSNRR
jgi:hypothetical protein